jgi:hypothetical protein
MDKLRQLEATGKHVFHGSPNGEIERMEPRQGHHVPDHAKPGETIKDGNPAISATPYAELAAFRAIINGKNVPFPHTSGFGVRNGKTEFRVSHDEVLDAVQGKKGYVYVFDKDKFVPYDRESDQSSEDCMEWRSYEPIRPLDVVEVDSSVLPERERIDKSNE